jgi:diacylglycerol kinase (ATP)
MIGIIINPLSGNGQGDKTWLKVQKELSKRKTDYIYKATSYSGEAYEIAASMVKDDRVNRIIAIGGDGTIKIPLRPLIWLYLLIVK